MLIFNHNQIYKSKPSPPRQLQLATVKDWIVNFLLIIAVILGIILLISAPAEDPTPAYSQENQTLTEKLISCKTETPRPVFCK
jgi:hypothetical protein